MPTESKQSLVTKLAALGVTPPAKATAADLRELLRKTRALPNEAPGAQRPPRPAVPPAPRQVPPAPAQRPTFVQTAPAVPSPPPRRSEHDERPWDPMAGF